MVDEKKPEAASSESTEEKTELKPEELERVSGGIHVTTPTRSTVRPELTNVPFAIQGPLPDASVM